MAEPREQVHAASELHADRFILTALTVKVQPSPDKTISFWLLFPLLSLANICEVIFVNVRIIFNISNTITSP